MNIFFLDNDPVLAAQAQCDKHIVKMILESAQIMCTVIRKTTEEFSNLEQPPYRATHKNHPCVKWAALSPDNFDWLYRHSIALCDEYTYRYDKIHKSRAVIEWCGKNRITQLLAGFTMPALAMPDEYKTDDPVESYRNYYCNYKRHTIDMRWTKRNPPEWWEH
jgi:hypothetical protein